MDEKLYVTIQSQADAQKVSDAGCAVLAEYPDALIVRATEAQRQTLATGGVEVTAYEQRPVEVAGGRFAFPAAVEANAAAPAPPPPPNRRAYYIVGTVGPIKGEWLETVRSLGGVVHGNLPGHALLVGLLPSRVGPLAQRPWVEGVTPYRAGMKVSPRLRPGVGERLRGVEIAEVRPAEMPREQAIEVSVFAGESTADLAAHVREAGGTVIKEGARSITVSVAPEAITRLAELSGVEAIVPFQFPKLRNDRAAEVMAVPANHDFGGHVLRGGGQIVGVGDSGLDTGVLATLHPDINGRVDSLVSFPTNPVFAPYTLDPPANDDGPADLHSAHGTHVAGSVLGNGTAAAMGPLGLAPEARLVFQAIEQKVNWKSASQLFNDGLSPFTPDWPPDAASLWGLPDDLVQLFQPAYTAGARIHTNSWGANDGGTYSGNARETDAFQFEHRDFLVLFSAGNAGLDDDVDGLIDTGSVGSPGTAKNCLTVGASENNRPGGSVPTPGLNARWDQLARFTTMTGAGHVSDDPDGMACFSSRGPVDGGRIKPDVVAPGTNILSTRSSVFVPTPEEPEPLWGDLETSDPRRGLYCWSGGTSMATPLVAGAAALVREYLVTERGHFQPGVKPSGALIKAMLIAGSVPMAGQFPNEIPDKPNFVCGFGRVNLTETLVGTVQQMVFDDEPDHAVESGQMRVFQLAGVACTHPLKVTLVWTDAPAPMGSGALQNRLYLQVQRPDGAVLDGDTTPFPNATNNVQQIVLKNPAAGTYRVRVRGISVSRQSPGAGIAAGLNPRQDFALVVTNGSGLVLI